MGEVVDQLPKVQIKKGYAADPAPDATTMFNFGTDYTRGLASNRSGARSTESEKTSYTKAVADRDRDEDTLSILRTSMATDGTRQVKTASYTLDSSAYNFSKARRSGKLSADDRFRAAHDYLERKRVMDTAKPEADASAAGAAGSNAQPSTPPGEPEETPKKKKSGGWINSFFG